MTQQEQPPQPSRIWQDRIAVLRTKVPPEMTLQDLFKLTLAQYSMCHSKCQAAAREAAALVTDLELEMVRLGFLDPAEVSFSTVRKAVDWVELDHNQPPEVDLIYQAAIKAGVVIKQL